MTAIVVIFLDVHILLRIQGWATDVLTLGVRRWIVLVVVDWCLFQDLPIRQGSSWRSGNHTTTPTTEI